eukprot:g47522.t1
MPWHLLGSYRGVPSILDGWLYVIGGHDCERYDSSNNSWEEVAKLQLEDARGEGARAIVLYSFACPDPSP